MFLKEYFLDLLNIKKYKRFNEKDDRNRRIKAQTFSIFTVILTLIYLVFIYKNLDLKNWYISYPFLIFEILGFLNVLIFIIIVWYKRFHDPKGIQSKYDFSTDVFITCFGEDFEIIKKTVLAAININYKNKKIYILDDFGDNKLKKLSNELNIKYIYRESNLDAKAGNLNNAFNETSGDLILTLDADQIPDPNILDKTIGYFNRDEIAFVQTKQDFDVPEYDPYCNLDSLFYDTMQPAKDSQNSAFSCGSGVIYRRKALNDINGFSTWNIVEDLHTSMLFHDKGWRSVYYNATLSKGKSPKDLLSIYKQRKQWAADALRILFWDNPFGRRGLSFLQKIQYSHTGLVYLFAGFVMPFFYILPILSLISGKYVFDVPLWEYLAFRIPSIIALYFTYKYYTQPLKFYRSILIWHSYFPSFISGAFSALFHRTKKPNYMVNIKISINQYFDEINTFRIKNFIFVLPHLTLVILSIFAISYGFYFHTGDLDVLIINTLWALWTIERLFILIFVAFTNNLYANLKIKNKDDSFILD